MPLMFSLTYFDITTIYALVRDKAGVDAALVRDMTHAFVVASDLLACLFSHA